MSFTDRLRRWLRPPNPDIVCDNVYLTNEVIKWNGTRPLVSITVMCADTHRTIAVLRLPYHRAASIALGIINVAGDARALDEQAKHTREGD